MTILVSPVSSVISRWTAWLRVLPVSAQGGGPGVSVAGRSARGWAGGELDCFRDEDRTCTMRRCEHGVPAELHLYAGA
jgi:hypothetical protein